MDFSVFIGRGIFFFTRARARIYRSAIAFSFCLVCPIISSQAQETQFIFDHTKEAATRKTMGVTDDCSAIKTKATARERVGSEGSWIDPRIQSTRGVIVLEGLVSGSIAKTLSTAFLSPYKNYPTIIPDETEMASNAQYPLAITMAATLTGEGNLTLHKSDTLTLHTNGQLYSYALPEITIPTEGLLRLYLGTNDQLYYDATLKHPFHSGSCGRANGR